jgi:hypothetical protein
MILIHKIRCTLNTIHIQIFQFALFPSNIRRHRSYQNHKHTKGYTPKRHLPILLFATTNNKIIDNHTSSPHHM